MGRRILVIKLGALGDIVLAFDAFHAIRTHHRSDHLTLLTRRAYAGWARQMPWFDEVWEDPALRWWQWTKVLRWRQRLRTAHFHRVYDLQGNDRTTFYFHLLGRARPEWSGAVRGCSHPRPSISGTQPVFERLLLQLESAGVPRAGRADLSWLRGAVAGLGLPAQYVVLVPGCSPHRPEKRWPPAHFAELARRLVAQGTGVVVVGTKTDGPVIMALKRAAPVICDLMDRTDLGQLASIARQARAVVGNDTGPVHLMATVGAPTLVLYHGKARPEVLRPNGPAVSWLQRPELRDLPVDEVWSWLKGKIGEPERCRRSPQ